MIAKKYLQICVLLMSWHVQSGLAQVGQEGLMLAQASSGSVTPIQVPQTLGPENLLTRDPQSLERSSGALDIDIRGAGIALPIGVPVPGQAVDDQIQDGGILLPQGGAVQGEIVEEKKN